MTLYIRPLSVSDLDQCVTVESAAFPPAEAATREKVNTVIQLVTVVLHRHLNFAHPVACDVVFFQIEYRLTVCPSICLGLFLRGATGNLVGTRQQGSIPVFADVSEESKNDRLIAHTISTQSASPVVKDEDMAVPVTWKTLPSATSQVGHNPDGRTIALHSLAVSPPFQRLGYGKKLMAVYIEEMRRTVQADRISILTYDRLVSYYQVLGFTHLGKSQSEYAGVAWHDLAYEFCTI